MSRGRALLAGTAAVAILAGGAVAAASPGLGTTNPFGTNRVGLQANGRILLPNNRYVTPHGDQINVTGEVVGTAISPDGSTFAIATGGPQTPTLNIVDASSGKVLQSVSYPTDAVASPVYSPDGTALYVAQPSSILKYTIGSDRTISDPTSPATISLPSGALPSGLQLSADGNTMYAALDGLNTFGIIDTTTGALTDQIPVGNTPWDVAIVGNKAFVSNRGGRPAKAGDTTTPAGNTPVVADPVTGATSTGTVSVVDLATDTVSDTVNVGLQPTSLAVHNGEVFVANTNDDTLSVIDASTDTVTQTINVQPLPGSSVGASPNSVVFAESSHLLVSIGGDDAVAVFGYDGRRSPVQYQGLIPTGWDPEQVQFDAKLGKVVVSSGKGIGEPAGIQSTSHYTGTVNSFALPLPRDLATLTQDVFTDNAWNNLPPLNSKGDHTDQSNGPLPAIPTQLGQPSAIKHVFIIDKENHAYDQDLGDIGKGNSDPALASYGAQVTPNEHSLANTFSLFDNFYDPSWRSTGGHEWVAQANENDMLLTDETQGQRRIPNPPGSDNGAFGFSAAYNSEQWQRSGFIWDAARRAGKTVRNYGEFETGETGTLGTWQQYYADSQILEGKASGTLPIAENTATWSSPQPSVNQITDPIYPTFDLNIPDQYRVDVWNQEFQQAEKTGNLPSLTLIALGNDHTGGTAPPDAAVADNDLALGRIVDEISHSQFWKDSAIFVVEDDSSMSVDHLSGHRAPTFIASPYAKRGVVNSDYYSQINVIKTVEQILGLQPLNQMDRAAVPMFSAFTNTPNFTPYNVVPNQIPLTEGVSGLIPLSPPSGASDTSEQATALAATSGPAVPPVPAADRPVASQWTNWYKSEAEPALTGSHAQPDSVNPPQLDRYDWYTSTNWSKPFPGDKKILAPDQVPGRNVPTGMSDS